jgi:hypothetical protein
MADFGALEFALTERLAFATDAGTYDSGGLEVALVERWVLVAAVAAGGMLFDDWGMEGGANMPQLAGGLNA